jgi:hypothetical protein
MIVIRFLFWHAGDKNDNFVTDDYKEANMMVLIMRLWWYSGTLWSMRMNFVLHV